MAMGGGNASAK